MSGLREVRTDGTFEGFRAAARGLLDAGVHPSAVMWSEGEGTGVLPGLLGEEAAGYGRAAGLAAHAARRYVPADFLRLARRVACYRGRERLDLLYRAVWRLARGDRGVLQAADADGAALLAMEQAVRHDEHRFHALLRFRRVAGEGGERWVAYHAPDHRTLRLAAPFFARRFHAMRWSVLTPDGSAHWDGGALGYGPAVSRRDARGGDDVEALWRTYYASTFDPARANPRLLRQHLPRRFLSALPEGEAVPALVRGARAAEAPAGERASERAALALTVTPGC